MLSRDNEPRGPRGSVLATSGRVFVGPQVYDAPERLTIHSPNHLYLTSRTSTRPVLWFRPTHMLATRLARRVASCSRLRASAQQQRALSSTPTPRPPPDHHDAIGLPPPPHVEEAREPEAETHEAAEKHDEKPQPVEDKGPRRPIDFFPDIDEPDATTMAVARVPLPNPFPGDSSAPRKQRRHPFNTYTFVTVLEKASVPEGTAKTLMVGTRQLLNQRSERATSNMLSKEELENVGFPRAGLWLTCAGGVSVQGCVVEASY